MGNILSVLFALLSLPIFAGEKVNRSIDTNGITIIEVRNDRGSVKVGSWDKNEVLVKGEIDDLADDFVFAKVDDSVQIEVKLTAKHAHGKNNGQGSKLEIWLPKSQNLRFNGIATDLNVLGLDGDVNIKSVSGSVVAESLTGNLKIKNISGKTTLNDISGNIDAAIVSGDLNANVLSKQIKVKSISSDIYVKTNQINNIHLISISGNTALSGKLIENSNITLENVSGESIYFYQNSIDAKVSIETGPDGSIINRIKPLEKKESHLNSQQQYFIEGEGKAFISMHTVSGKVGLKDVKEMQKGK